MVISAPGRLGRAVAACYRQAITDTLLRALVMELQIFLKARLGHG